jgi:hypothetical protein
MREQGSGCRTRKQGSHHRTRKQGSHRRTRKQGSHRSVHDDANNAAYPTTEINAAGTSESGQRGCTTRARVRARQGRPNERMGCKHAAPGHRLDSTTQEPNGHTARGS